MDIDQWLRLLLAAVLGVVLAWMAKRKHRHATEWGLFSFAAIAVLGMDVFFVLAVLLFLLRPICPHCHIPLVRQRQSQRYRCEQCGYVRPLPSSPVSGLRQKKLSTTRERFKH